MDVSRKFDPHRTQSAKLRRWPCRPSRPNSFLSTRGKNFPLAKLDVRYQSLDIVTVVFVTFDVETEHVEDGNPILGETAARQRIALRHLVLDPQLLQCLECQPPALAQLVHYPHIVLELLSLIHLCDYQIFIRSEGLSQRVPDVMSKASYHSFMLRTTPLVRSRVCECVSPILAICTCNRS